MFCKNCGNQIAEGVAFCNVCGTPTNAPKQAPVQQPVQQVVYQAPVQQPAYQAPVQQPVQQYAAPMQQPVYQAPVEQYAPQYAAPAPQKSNGKLIAIIIAVVILVAGLVVGGIFLFGGDGSSSGSKGASAEEVAKKYAIASCELDAEGLVDVMADFVILKASKDQGYDEINKEAVIENTKSSLNAMSGQLANLEYEIIEAKRDDDWSGADSTLSNIRSSFGSDAADSVSEVCRVKVKMNLNGKEQTMPVIVVKENGNWRVMGVGN